MRLRGARWSRSRLIQREELRRIIRAARLNLRSSLGFLRGKPDVDRPGDKRRRWADGTTHLVFDPVEFLERLAALVPRPRINLVLYYGVLAPRAAWREEVVPSPATDSAVTDAVSTCRHTSRIGRRPNRAWAELMERSFGFDVLACPRCGGRNPPHVICPSVG